MRWKSTTTSVAYNLIEASEPQNPKGDREAYVRVKVAMDLRQEEEAAEGPPSCPRREWGPPRQHHWWRWEANGFKRRLELGFLKATEAIFEEQKN